MSSSAPLAQLSAQEIRDCNRHSGVPIVQPLGTLFSTLLEAGQIYRRKWAAPAATATANILAAVTLGVAAADSLVYLAQPDVPRTVKFTVALAGGSLAGSAIVEGTDEDNNFITENVALTTATTYETTRAYKTITRINLPARTTSGDTVALGYGTKLGLGAVMFTDSILYFNTDGPQDTYTLTQSQTDMSKNLIVPNTAPNAAHNYRVGLVLQRD